METYLFLKYKEDEELLEKQWDCSHPPDQIEYQDIELDQDPEQTSVQTIKTGFCKLCGLQIEEY